MRTELRPLPALLIESVKAVEGDVSPSVLDLTVDALHEAARLHRVVPAVRRRLRTAGNAPTKWTLALDGARHAQLLRHMQAAHDLRMVRDEFAAHRVRWAISKGPVLSDLVWPSVDMREYTDLDVFVHPADFAVALDALENAGFAFVDRNWPELRRQARAEVAMRGPSGFPLDLHWDIAVTPHARREFNLDLPEMLSHTRLETLGTGVDAPVFDATDLLMHVAFHAAASGANRLVWIADVYHAAKLTGINWSLLEQRTFQARVSTPVALVLARVERTFDVTLPLPHELRRRALATLSGRLAARRDAEHPFPGLPDDASLSGIEYASARESGGKSVTAAIWQWYDVRRIEAQVRRNGAVANPLDIDVPDAEARREYLRVAALSS